MPLIGKIRVDQISILVEKVLSALARVEQPTLEELLEADRWAREESRSRVARG